MTRPYLEARLCGVHHHLATRWLDAPETHRAALEAKMGVTRLAIRRPEAAAVMGRLLALRGPTPDVRDLLERLNKPRVMA